MKSSLFLCLALLCIVVAKPLEDALKEPKVQPEQNHTENQQKGEQDKPEARNEPELAADEQKDYPVSREAGIRQYVISIPELQEQQFKAFDDQGRYSFGYAFPQQVHLEARDGDGTVKGTYIYRDPSGRNNQVQYQADSNGFRVVTDNLPVFNPVLPVPVQDTPEVEEARKQHLALWSANYQSQTGAAPNFQIPQKTPLESSSDDGYVAPLDLPPRPVPDAIVDSAKQSVIIQSVEKEEDPDSYDIESDPVKLLAQLYSKHLTSSNQNPEPIQRPKDFYPQNIPDTYNSFDLFRRTQSDAVAITNPEFIDLKNFLLTNRFRTALDSQNQEQFSNNKESESKPENDETSQIHQEEKKQNDQKQAEPVDQKLKITAEKTEEKSQVTRPIVAQVYRIPQELYNQYFNLPPGTVPIILTRDALDKLPESLKAVALGLPTIDGSHDAQVAPFQRIYSPYPKYTPRTGPSPYFVPYLPGQPYPAYPFQEYYTPY